MFFCKLSQLVFKIYFCLLLIWVTQPVFSSTKMQTAPKARYWLVFDQYGVKIKIGGKFWPISGYLNVENRLHILNIWRLTEGYALTLHNYLKNLNQLCIVHYSCWLSLTFFFLNTLLHSTASKLLTNLSLGFILVLTNNL